MAADLKEYLSILASDAMEAVKLANAAKKWQLHLSVRILKTLG
jgi:hypothetical protein